VLRQNKNLIPN